MHLLDVERNIIPVEPSDGALAAAADDAEAGEHDESDTSDADLVTIADQLELAEHSAKAASSGPAGAADAGRLLGSAGGGADAATTQAEGVHAAAAAADTAAGTGAGGAGSATLCSIITGTSASSSASSSTAEPQSSNGVDSDIEIDEAPIRPTTLKLRPFAFKTPKSPLAATKPRHPYLKRQLAIDGGTPIGNGPIKRANAELIWSDNKPPMLIAKPARATGKQYASFALSNADLAASTAAKFGGGKRGRPRIADAVLH